MNAARLTIFLLALSLSACEYHEVVGRRGDPTEQIVGAPDAAVETGCQGSECNPGDCSSFQIPSSDCTAGLPSCSFDKDCEAIGGRCNIAIRRCFRDDSVCVGTMCDFNDDCPATERCNMTAHVCYDPNASQVCMPCFLADTDCGLDECDHEAGKCI